MSSCEIIAENIYFSYGKEKILKGLNLYTKKGDILIIKGPNGSGKSTLIKILAGILTIESGKIKYIVDENEANSFENQFYIGFCSIEQNLYEELTIYENLEFLLKLRNIKEKEKIENYLKKANLYDKRDKYYKNLSSGMKQRVKILSAFLHNPIFLFLDEPGSNLDENGIELLSTIISEQMEKGICIFATNDERDFKYGNKTIELPL